MNSIITDPAWPDNSVALETSEKVQLLKLF